MELLSKPKPAEGYTYDGQIESVSAFMDWLRQRGYTINTTSVVMNGSKWDIRIQYHSQAAGGYIPTYHSVDITAGVHVMIDGKPQIYSYADETAALQEFDQAPQL